MRAHLSTILLACGAGYLGGTVASKLGSRDLELRRLILRDARGVVRCSLDVTEDNKAQFRVADASGEFRAGIAVTGDGGALVALGSPQGRRSVGLVTSPNGRLGLTFTDNSGIPIVSLGVLPDGPTALTIHDGTLKSPRVQAGKDWNGHYGVMVTDAQGKPVWGGPSTPVR